MCRSGIETGQAPGTLYIDPDASDTRVRLWLINETEVVHLDDPSIESIQEMRARPGRLWINLAGFGDDARIRAVGELFGLHPVVLAGLAWLAWRKGLSRYTPAADRSFGPFMPPGGSRNLNFAWAIMRLRCFGLETAPITSGASAAAAERPRR